MNKPRHTFPKAEKLKSRKQIDLLFQGGKSFFAAPVKCYYRVDELMGLQVDELKNLPADGHGLQVDRLIYGENETGNIHRPKLVERMDEMENMNHEEEKQTRMQIINNKSQIINIKAGVSVSKRNFKHSVDRNRIKRLLREAYRLHKHTLQEKLQAQNKTMEVFFVFTDKSLPAFALVEEKMKYCLRRLGKIVEGGV